MTSVRELVEELILSDPEGCGDIAAAYQQAYGPAVEPAPLPPAPVAASPETGTEPVSGSVTERFMSFLAAKKAAAMEALPQ